MRVEDERGDIVETVGIHRLGQPPLQALDRQAGRDLPDETPCIGKARLDRDAAPFARIIAIIGLGEQEVEETPAMLERGLGLEQGRYVDLVGDPEQPREVKGGEHRRRLFAFGNQHADRRVGVDMLEDLRHREELTHRGRAFHCEAGKVGALRFHPGQQFAQGGDGPAA